MRNRPTTILAFVTLGLVALPTLAAQRDQQDPQQKLSPRQFRRMQMTGEEVRDNVTKLSKELRWHRSLGGALDAGRREGKPVIWIQALGDLNGFL